MQILETLRSILPISRSSRGIITPSVDDFDLPLSLDAMHAARTAATIATHERRETNARESLMVPGTMAIDTDDWQYRKLTNGKRLTKRDLTPLQQTRMLQIAWYLFEQNPLGRRLVELMTDLILGEGTTVQADDERIAEQIAMTWDEDMDVFTMQMSEHHNALSINGELIVPCTVNPITGRPTHGYIDPYDVERVIYADNNPLVPDIIELRPENYASRGQQFKVIRRNPVTRMLEGDCFYTKINGLPNASRGRSDLLSVADWLDLYDQLLYAQVERLQLLSAFVWDLEIQTSDQKVVDEKARNFPPPRPGMLYAHNSAEKLEAKTPELRAADSSESAKALRTHIGGSRGFPASYLGDMDSNHATIQGQNDVMMKTPARRQKHFGLFLKQNVVFLIQSTTQKNPALFRDVRTGFKVVMPEIAAKDVSRAAAAFASVAAANDTALASGTISKRVARMVNCGIVGQLGVQVDQVQMAAEIEQEEAEREAKAAELQTLMAQSARDPNQNGAAGDGDPDVVVTKRQRPSREEE